MTRSPCHVTCHNHILLNAQRSRATPTWLLIWLITAIKSTAVTWPITWPARLELRNHNSSVASHDKHVTPSPPITARPGFIRANNFWGMKCQTCEMGWPMRGPRSDHVSHLQTIFSDKGSISIRTLQRESWYCVSRDLCVTWVVRIYSIGFLGRTRDTLCHLTHCITWLILTYWLPLNEVDQSPPPIRMLGSDHVIVLTNVRGVLSCHVLCFGVNYITECVVTWLITWQ